ncbi:MAG: hypothetical protein JW807_14845 [Spirochaetes bacterium]|nr:hypothetical protein [Spirochaetota bacterium]
MKKTSIVTLVIYLALSAFTGLNYIPLFSGNPSMLLAGMYANIVFGWLIYAVGMWTTKPHGVEMKMFYFYPLFLQTCATLVYSFMVTSVMEGNVTILVAAFCVSLVSYSIFYCAGMIIAGRDMQGKEIYFNRDSFSFSLVYVVPTAVITPLVCYFLRNSFAGLLIGTIVMLVFGAVFIYMGIADAAGDWTGRPGYVKGIIWLAVWGTTSAATIVVSLSLIELQLGKFLDLWISASAVLINFLVAYPIAVMAAGLLYKSEHEA